MGLPVFFDVCLMFVKHFASICMKKEITQCYILELFVTSVYNYLYVPIFIMHLGI